MNTERFLSNHTLTLAGHLLIAMPKLSHSPFDHGVCYLCQHDELGAIALLINQPIAMSVADLFFDQHLKTAKSFPYYPLLIGGPLQRERGFVLHQQTGAWRTTLPIANDIAITTSQDILSAIAQQKAPQDFMIILGYASWGPGQLEYELSQTNWLIAPATPELLFHTPYEQRWHQAMDDVHFNLAGLIEEDGHA